MKIIEAKGVKHNDTKAQIFGVGITSSPKEEVLRNIQEKLENKYKFFIVTPNSEILLMASQDILLREILNKADFSIPDGFGIKLMYGLNIIHGRILFIDLLTLLDKTKGKVYLLGGKDASLTNNALVRLADRYNNLTIEGNAGPMIGNKGIPVTKKDEELERRVLKEINELEPDMLFVGFGCPRQEKWVYKNFDKLEVGGVMVVGRTFEYFSGKYPLPPRFMDKLGLEWLWRLLTGSTNISRIFKAVIIFPWKVFVAQNVKAKP